uniref:Solute-binding protein family 3/N-terminal domain-containing protein n=1 Tax=uncultured marine group II/III euryarchaeote AD1000_58_D12 TaxID=1457789 RepID=A0A075FZV0_9EURY|nr:hypothetical protein [uncultured marine group II/III euryarchaeote AD1000_58_D12]
MLTAPSVSAAGDVQYVVGTSEETDSSGLLESHQHITEVAFQDYNMAMRDLMVGNIDFFLTTHSIAADPATSENTPGLSIVGMVEEIESYVPVVRPDSQTVIGSMELLDAMNAALGELISSNSLSATYMTWFIGESEMDASSFEGSIGEWPTPTEGGVLHSIIDNQREMVACMYDRDSPMSWQDASAQMNGYEAEVSQMMANRIGAHYGAQITFRGHDSGGEFEAIEDLKRGDTCDFIMASITPQKAMSKGLMGGIPYHIEGYVLMASEESPALQSAQHLFLSADEDEGSEFDQRWIAITFLSAFIAYQLVRRQ